MLFCSQCPVLSCRCIPSGVPSPGGHELFQQRWKCSRAAQQRGGTLLPVQHHGPLYLRTGPLAVPSVPLHQGFCTGKETAQCTAGSVGLLALLHLPHVSALIQQPFPVLFPAAPTAASTAAGVTPSPGSGRPPLPRVSPGRHAALSIPTRRRPDVCGRSESSQCSAAGGPNGQHHAAVTVHSVSIPFPRPGLAPALGTALCTSSAQPAMQSSTARCRHVVCCRIAAAACVWSSSALPPLFRTFPHTISAGSGTGAPAPHSPTTGGLCRAAASRSPWQGAT